MSKIKNQTGISLIEVLASVVLLSLILITITTLLNKGLMYTNKAESTSSLQQEANRLVFTIKKYHENGENYSITVSDKVSITNLTTGSEETFSNVNFDYDIEINSSSIATIEIKPNEMKEFQLQLTIINNSEIINGRPQEYKIKTTLSRL